MTNYYEIDFLEAGEKKSGDAICLRYGDSNLGSEVIHVVDGGYTEDGQKLLNHIAKFYGKNSIDHVILTHPDGDHAGGLKKILETALVGTLWMNRPWLYVDDLLPRFEYPYTREGLIQRLKKDFGLTADLEKIADERGITIREAFQGTKIGEFTVLTPTKNRYIDLIIDSEKTPDPEREARFLGKVYTKVIEAVNFVRSLWGHENLKGDTEGTSRENEMSIVQYFGFDEHRILLTGDTGVEGLEEAYQYATNNLGLALPGVTKFQVPHHGGRRNVSTEILDKWLGKKVADRPSTNEMTAGSAIVSANKNDADHPKKDVVRAIWHRGYHLATTERIGDSWVGWHFGLQARPNSGPAPIVDYPEDSES